MGCQWFSLVSQRAEPGKFAVPTGTQCRNEEKIGGQIAGSHDAPFMGGATCFRTSLGGLLQCKKVEFRCKMNTIDCSPIGRNRLSSANSRKFTDADETFSARCAQ